ncbi:MAG: MoaD/ThiS family protein [Rhodospirillales bacterium]|nr:MoaD/ThiS family protein [Rhodospirillales bacterium]MCY3855788.1 MoaD/ThiS family protein [Rhodospirillales bacterium]MCY4003056.1 MoaD/ThiS family protein [Rhodospirillales bacterium]MDE0371109.1 MoaD/ThiS family protein [Rhodospirillales bacterium]
MARVVFTGNFRHLVGDDSEADIPASNVRDLLNRLGERYPALAPHLDEGIAVAIDGEIHQDALFSPVGPDSEVYLMPKIAGG